ncbi:hypothetical protein F5Y11DRAFT_241542 [Daldinia sp. FL1419]|nr:hypothetical protein F5Y11DRAFT_241542 [Daldinia sp. FL1419]
MSFGNTLLAKLGNLSEGGMSTILSSYTSPSRRRSEEHDLAELSPRPDDALLPPNSTRDFAYRDNSLDTPRSLRSNTPNMNDPSSPSSRPKGKGKAIAFAYQGRPRYSRAETPDSLDDLSEPRGTDLQVPPGIWRPNIHIGPQNNRRAVTNTRPSLVESIFGGRPDRSSDRTVQSDVDSTFKMLYRRERQLEKELQKLLDAQGDALQRDLEGGDTGKSSPSSTRAGFSSPDAKQSSAQTKLSEGTVVPVRQPKNRPLSKRRARIGIARSVTMLADLKNEEEAYIAGALAERKAALARLRNLSSQHLSITEEMKALEEDTELPIKTEIAKMESQHRTVCANIEKLEEKLRLLRRTKASLEQKLDEARSTREACLSGYRGALKQCDQGISELMKYPGVRVLEIEDLKKHGGPDFVALTSKYMSGIEFLSLRPERRTIEMAKEWWEGEVAMLEQRKAAVDKERAALEEGNEIWQQTLTRISDFENGLNQALQDATIQHDLDSGDPASIIREKYTALREVLHEIQRTYDYVCSRGWNLLIAAIGAELAHFEDLKYFLADMIRSSGYDDDVITPVTSAGSNDLVDVRGKESTDVGLRSSVQDDDDDELSRSVVRRWDNPDAQQPSSPPADLLGAPHRDESDNEVPPGLFTEAPHHESEDESHNDVPAEFLSMHSPLQTRAKDPPAPNGDRLRRESSEAGTEDDNQVPLDLLSESRRDDGVD